MREQRVQKMGDTRLRLRGWLLSWRFLGSLAFVLATAAIGFVGASALPFAAGQRIEYPLYAAVDFQIPDPVRTKANEQSAQASTPSYYRWNAPGVTRDRIKADLRSLYEAAAAAQSFDEFAKAVEPFGVQPDASIYERFKSLANMPENLGRERFFRWIDEMDFDHEFVVRGLLKEPRTPSSTAEYIILEETNDQGQTVQREIRLTELVRIENEKALAGSAAALSKPFLTALRPAVEAIILRTLRDQPTIVYNAERTQEKMREAKDATPQAVAVFERGKPLVTVVPGILGSEELNLLRAHHQAYRAFLREHLPDTAEFAAQRSLQSELRLREWLRQAGMSALLGFLAIGTLLYTAMHQRDVLENRPSMVSFATLIVGTVLVSRLMHLQWPQIGELVLLPALLAASILAIVFPRRFALGAICIVALMVTIASRGGIGFLLALLTGVTATVFQLNEIRNRTRIITAGALTALAIIFVTIAAGLQEGHAREYLINSTLAAGASAMLAAFFVSGLLPFIERIFGVATSLTLLEWRDPTRKLLQLLAQEAPGTYNHSLVLGTLAQSACERIGANALLAQVGALYHDIGKIPKAEYFTENQEGRTNRHEHLAPTMSLLIILGHVKDGIEMAKEYKLPLVLRRFIEEHHGTCVVRYFHHVASEKQPQIATGRHDREVSEAEFRYPGPKPHTKESAVIMLADGVEGAVRSLKDPTVGRIESTVHNIVQDRLSDGQFGDCDITMREIRLVEESLVKSLCSIYHGRVAYPRSSKGPATVPALREEPKRLSG
ncbi:MAG: HDIG domain-containing protein [Phycisphaerae bacterium]|nr:HDIG domain-containing protein [Phycisphaerae bacterium]